MISPGNSTNEPTAMVIGAYGQDGILLCDELEATGTKVIKVGKGDCDLLSAQDVKTLFSHRSRHDCYFLAAIHRSSEMPDPEDPPADLQNSLALHVNAPANILETMRQRDCGDRFFYAASSRIFGSPRQSPQTEQTPREPRCVYGITKSAGMDVCRYYRHTFGVFASSGILYNHESSLRPLPFISRKIVLGVVACRRGLADRLQVKTLDARVDWSFAPDIVRAMILVVNQPLSQDFVLASGVTHSVRDFVRIAFHEAGLDWRQFVTEEDARQYPPFQAMVGDNSLLRQLTGWRPSVTFEEMIRRLVREALAQEFHAHA